MLDRVIQFVGFAFIGGIGGSVFDHYWPHHAALTIGVLLAIGVWLLIDSWRFSQLFGWLRQDNSQDSAPLPGAWGEVSTRIRRMLRARERRALDHEARLDDFLSALQASPNGVMLLDAESRIEWCNQTAASHFGLDTRRDVQQAVGNLVRDPGFAAYLANGEFGGSLSMPGRDSTPSRPVTLSVQLHPYGEGRKLLLSRDVTALEQAEAMRRDFVANVSHEIRTPLTVLSGFVETLQTLALKETERQQYLSLMAQQAERMQSLVNDLLTLSRLEGSAPPGLDMLVSVPKMMRQLQTDAMALSQIMGMDQGIDHLLEFNCSFEGNLAGVASELLSALGNLISNAVRYTPLGGQIKVDAWRDADGRLLFSVADTGPGIASEHLGRLTERFYRVDRSRSRETGGTGLGLAIVKHVAQRHGATLSIESTVGKGSKFSLAFPPNRVS